MKNQPRVDPVITELIGGVKGSEDETIASSLVGALANVITNASKNVGEQAREACVELLADAFRGSHSGEMPARTGRSTFADEECRNLCPGYRISAIFVGRYT
jgi:hypothetical protein